MYEYTPEELQGPEQPIEFSHKVHATTLGIDCLYCHSAAEKSQSATIPAVSVCMGCHQYVSEGATPGSKEQIAKLRDYYARGESIPWLRIHNPPEHVQFKHFRHVESGLQCQECHGPVEQMNRVYLVPDTKYRKSSAGMPAAKLEMGWCMDCHLARTEPNTELRSTLEDCAACHY